MARELTVLRDVRIPTQESGVTLSADLFVVLDGEPAPALITLLPYRNDAASGIEFDETLRWLAARGYACLLVDFRGTGSSDGEQRPPFDATEADDAVAAIAWAAQQPWCNGNVGMWGMSYGAIMALRTAARAPAHLKAILAIEGALDPERDFIHPAGSEGCLGSVGVWGTETLLNQMLPPLHDFGGASQQRRWEIRVQVAEPWLVDIVRHGPGHPVWRSRAIDASKIAVPSFIVAGWRDLFCDASLRAYEAIDAPKKLLVGPWMHTCPDGSPYLPIEFRALALRWWDYWLKGLMNGLMQEPPVTVYVQGARPEWRNLSAWSPEESSETFVTTENFALTQVSTKRREAEGSFSSTLPWTPDPTVGALAGLWGFPTSGFGLPADQHDDDVRCILTTSAPLESDALLGGRSVVLLKWSAPHAPQRVVARMTDVDENGVSTLISTGVLSSSEPAAIHEVVLNATCYRVPCGHRLRVALGNSDFPRLWPTGTAEDGARGTARLSGVELRLTKLRESQGTITVLSSPAGVVVGQSPLTLHMQPSWKVNRDMITQSVSVEVGQHSVAFTPNRDHMLELDGKVLARVSRDVPRAASARCTYVATIRMKAGDTVIVRVTTLLNCGAAHAFAMITSNDQTVFSREWHALRQQE